MAKLDPRQAAATLLGMKPSEIATVNDSPAGKVIVTTDGTSLIEVPADRPDADGCTGLMLLAPPREGEYSMHVYTAHAEDLDELDDDPDAPDDGTDALEAEIVSLQEQLEKVTSERDALLVGRDALAAELAAAKTTTAAPSASPGAKGPKA